MVRYCRPMFGARLESVGPTQSVPDPYLHIHKDVLLRG